MTSYSTASFEQRARWKATRIIYRIQNWLTSIADRLMQRHTVDPAFTSSGQPRFTSGWDKSKEELVTDINAEPRFKAYPDSYNGAPDMPSYIRIQFCGWALFLGADGIWSPEDTSG